MLKHTIEELGEYADTHAEGAFHLFQNDEDYRRERTCGEDHRWGCQIGRGTDTQYAATPKEAVQKVLDAADAARNPDNF